MSSRAMQSNCTVHNIPLMDRTLHTFAVHIDALVLAVVPE